MNDILASVLLLADDDHGWGHMFDWDGGWMWLWGLLMMTFWAVVIGVVVWLVVRETGSRRSSSHDRAREILAERYARGELDTEDYRERMEGLR